MTSCVSPEIGLTPPAPESTAGASVTAAMELTEQFHEHFQVSIAQTPEDEAKAYQLRFRVYCEEFGYLDPRDRPHADYISGIERDEFDERSAHCLITHRHTGELAGCVRVVTTEDSLHEDPLPLEKHCLPALSLGTLELLAQARSQVGEISRLTVAPEFRCHTQACVDQAAALPSHLQEFNGFSLIGMSALVSAAASLDVLGLNEVVAMMNPALPRLLRRSGIMFCRAGDVVDYHGRRAPYHMSIDTFREHIALPWGVFYEDVRAQLCTETRMNVEDSTALNAASCR